MISFGSSLGPFNTSVHMSLLRVGSQHLGFVGAACELAALALLLVNQARDARSQQDGSLSVAPNAASSSAVE
jgi:hypothetical protein